MFYILDMNINIVRAKIFVENLLFTNTKLISLVKILQKKKKKIKLASKYWCRSNYKIFKTTITVSLLKQN